MTKYNDDDTFLARWLNDNLTPEELEDFENSEDYQSFSKIAKQSTKFDIPIFNQTAVKTKINSSLTTSKTKVRSLYYGIAIAASVAIFCTIVGINFWNTTTTIVSNFGETKIFTLPDGSTVELNGNSEIAFLKKDWENQNRKLSLKGEGFFTVKKGSKFTVESKEGKVHVVGTEFNVRVLNHFYAVECYEGKVLVEKNNKNVFLTRGTGLHYKNEKMEQFTFTNTNPNWKNNNYIYNKTPLSVVFNDLQNVYNIPQLNIKKTDLSLEFTGKLVVDDLTKALNIICKPMNLKYTISQNEIIIISK